ncbi:uncharacterized protein LOC124493765 [Dermatophagoides farinae]|uniref:uncharacterized protein LOC124493765 n=1 Tax=Dermatophagoides farinae TaxID=6954 RepID=UPI003F5FBEF9
MMAPRRGKKKKIPIKNRSLCRQFCRQGKCDRGVHCSFIHDPNKRGICPGILSKYGCNKQECFLSHDQTPDKMPDCRFFLRGRCTANNCSYRHVKVNKDAKLCENFALGFCMKGLTCNKLHNYKCPMIRLKKKCPYGDQCNHYHPPPPQNQSNSMKPSTSKKMKKSKFKKINNKTETNTTNNNNGNQQSSQVTTTNECRMNLSSPNTKNILNQMLTKQLKQTNVDHIDESKSNQSNDNDEDKSMIKKIIEQLSFIPLSKDGDIDAMDSLKTDWIQMIRRLRHNNSDDNDCRPSSTNMEEKPKYFIIDDSDDDDDDYKLSAKKPSSSSSNETNIYRPKLKIIPDFLQDESL